MCCIYGNGMASNDKSKAAAARASWFRRIRLPLQDLQISITECEFDYFCKTLQIKGKMLQLLNSSGSRLFGRQGSQIILSNRGVVRIPHWEYHIRFDPKYGRKRPCQDVLDRFKRLNNGGLLFESINKFDQLNC